MFLIKIFYAKSLSASANRREAEICVSAIRSGETQYLGGFQASRPVGYFYCS